MLRQKEGAIYYRRFTFAADNYSPRTLEAQPVAEFVKVADQVSCILSTKFPNGKTINN